MRGEAEPFLHEPFGIYANGIINPADIPRMLKIAASVGGYSWAEEELLRVLYRPTVIGKGVRTSHSREVVGYAAYNYDKGQGLECELPFFLIDLTWRDKGVGEQLRDFIWTKAKKAGFQNMYILVKASEHPEDVAANEGYFRSLGFVTTETVVKEDGEYYKMVYSGPG